MLSRKHYTKRNFAAAILGVVPSLPSFVLDPCCGAGSLLQAANELWPSATLAGMEISERAAAVAGKNIPRALVCACDAFQMQWLVGDRKPDLIVCNPPFNGESRRPLGERMDLKFFQAAFDAIAPGGTIVLVLPFSVAANPSFREWRRTLFSRYSLIAGVDLPHNAFEHTDAAAVAVVLRATSDWPTRFVRLGADARIVAEARCSVDDTYRLDAHYYLSRAAVPDIAVRTVALRDLIERARRGRYITSDMRTRSRGRRMIGLPELSGSSRGRFVRNSVAVNAKSGDVLLSRVGRRAGLDVLVVSGNFCGVVNDCAFILTPRQYPGYLAAAFMTNYVRSQLLAVRRGMATRVLNKDDLLGVQIPILERHSMQAAHRAWTLYPMRRGALIQRLDRSFGGRHA